METRKIVASHRSGRGKGPARRLRSQGQIPAVVYGKSTAARSLSVAPKDLQQVLESERGRNTVIELDLEGKQKMTVLLGDYQRHPVTRELLHADFLHVGLDQPVNVDVPLELLGKPRGVVMGGTLRQVFRKLPLRCLVTQIPTKITHDVSHLELDMHVATKELKLPEGVEVRLAKERTVAAVVTEKKRGAEEEAVQAEQKPEGQAAAEAPSADAKAASEKK